MLSHQMVTLNPEGFWEDEGERLVKKTSAQPSRLRTKEKNEAAVFRICILSLSRHIGNTHGGQSGIRSGRWRRAGRRAANRTERGPALPPEGKR